ncbi:MAG TPA: FAD-binding oxidoreductase [Thermoanaerobaculia bacterium]|nr:FAD-binding oxidoreductase [Thermoanaerobaculia bacterium]
MYWTTSGIPSSLWLLRRGEPREADAVVVGGGIVGLSAAWWLARLGGDGFRVVVLEQGNLACRASGRNAGFLLTGTPQPFASLVADLGRGPALAMWERSRENRELVRGELLDPGLVDCEFLPEGSWIASLAGTRQESDLAASHQALAAEGFAVEWRDAAAVRAASGSEKLGGALFQARDGGLDPVRLCRGLAACGGFTVRAGVRVRELEPAGDRVRVVGDGAHFLTPRVVVALNAYSTALLPHLADDVRAVRGQMLATDPPGDAGARRLEGVWYINEGHEYLRQLPDGTVVLGGARITAEAAEVGYLESPTAQVQGALDAFLASAFPHLAGPVRHRWAGTMAFTPDGLVLTGDVPDLPGALYAAGFNGHGMSLGFAAGRWLARRALGEDVGEFLSG